MAGTKDWQRIHDSFEREERKWQAKHDRIWADMSKEQRLAAADVIFRAINDNARISGSYRKLIYDHLNFDEGGAYTILYCAGGQNITNFFEYPKMEDTTDG